MENLVYIITDQSVTLHINGEAMVFTVENPKYALIKQAIRDRDFALVRELANTKEQIQKFSVGNITVEGNAVYYKGEPVHNLVVERIVGFINEGLPAEPLINFLNRLMENPSRRSVQELYKFLEHKNLPITNDGKFRAYKAVRSDWKDKYSGKFDNSVGNEVRLPHRNMVDDDANVGCSYGLHVGSLEYVSGFGSRANGDKFIIVEVDPVDVVSVPHDCNCQKVRCVGYKVVAEYTGPLPELYDPVDYDDYDDYDDESVEDEYDYDPYERY